MELIKNIINKLKERSQNVTPDGIIRLESIADQIDNLYKAIEDLLKIILVILLDITVYYYQE